MTKRPITLACLDLAGTTVADGGIVEASFLVALDELRPNGAIEDRRHALEYVKETMGQSKIEVFRAIFGNEDEARRANRAFEDAYASSIAENGAMAIPGAEESMKALRENGMKVALLTGFSPTTRDLLVDALGWRELADLVLCPAEAGRGRPYPDLVLTAVLRLGIDDVADVAVAGDTASDIVSGRRAGASVVVGVLTGADPRERLEGAGATHVLESIATFPDVLRGD